MDRSKFTYHRLEKPTVKQISYASAISEYLGVDLPIEPTKAAYSRWIDKYSQSYKEAMRDIALTHEAYMESIDLLRDW